MLIDQFLADDPHRELDDVDRLGIKQRHAELFGVRNRELHRAGQTLLEQQDRYRYFLLACSFERLARLGLGHHTLHDEATDDACQASQRGGAHQGCHLNPRTNP